MPFARASLPNRWLQLLFGIVAMVTVANLQYSWVLFVAPLDAKFHWGRPAIQIAFTIFLLTETWLVPVAGWFADKHGPRPVMIAAAALVAAAWAIDAAAGSLPVLYLAAAIGGLGAGAVYGCCVGNALKWFADRRGLAVGLTTAAYGVGSAVTAIPILAMIERHGYAAAFFRFGVAQGMVVLAMGLLLAAPGRPARRPRRGPPQAARDTAPLAMLRTRIFWLIYALYVVVYAAGIMAVAQLPAVAWNFGIARMPVGFVGLVVPALAFALAIDRVLSGLTRPFFGWVSDLIGREITMAITFGLQGVGLWALYAFGRDPGSFVALSGLVYFSGSQVFSLFQAALADSFGVKYATTNAGLLYTAKGTGALLIPVGTYLFHATGSWHAVFVLAGAVNLLAATLALFVLRPRRFAAIKG